MNAPRPRLFRPTFRRTFRRTPLGASLLGATTALVVGLLPVGAATAAEPTPPARQTLDTAALAAGLSDLQAAGGVGIVARVSDGKQSWAGALGEASPGVPATSDARFRAASITKSFTSVLALQMVESGEWTLDTRIADVLPDLWKGRGRVTLGQLLSHTSGMPEHLLGVLAKATTTAAFLDEIAEPRTDRELVRGAKKQEWQARPGTEFHYSNTNFVVVGMMLERATGLRLKTLMKQRILRPAGLRDTNFAVRPGLGSPSLQESIVLEQQRVSTAAFDPTLFSASGAIVSTTRDLDRFQQALSRGRLLRPGLVREMRRVSVPEDTPIDYGLGSYRFPDPCTPGGFVHGHDGGSYGTLSMSLATPDGRTRVTVAMTGRNVDDLEATDAVALFDYALGAFATTCGAAPAAGLGKAVLPGQASVTR